VRYELNLYDEEMLHHQAHWTAALFWVITQREVIIPYRYFGTTYRSYRQGWSWRWDW